MLSEQVHTFEQHDVVTVVFDGKPFFRAVDVTSFLGYKNSAKAVRTHVTPKNVKTLQDLQKEGSSCITVNIPNRNLCQNVAGRSPLYLNESGIYELIFQSVKAEAFRFREWLVEEVLPEIRKTGKYARHEQLSLMNETDLHFKVVDFVRKQFPEAIIIAGLGELQDTDSKRISAYRKGYTKGQPDILILNRTRKSSGLAIELKTPLGCGKTSPEQDAFLNTLTKNKFETVLSCIYDDIVVKIIEYSEAARRCNRAFVC
jgi:prophage antirepressor-like protein